MDTFSPKPLSGPLVSICTLTYNREHYLNVAIDSVVAQTYSNWELILIDDGSTDATEKTVLSYNDDRIKYIKHGKRAGLLARRRESLMRAKGTYIAVLDSDDCWKSPEKLKKQVAYLEAHPECAVVGTFVTFIDTLDEEICTRTYCVDDAEIRSNMLVRNQFIHSSVLMRKSMIEKTEGYRIPLAEDWDLFLQLGMVGMFANIPEYLTCHRIHDESTTDRGAKMASAVQGLIYKYRNAYPRFHLAILKNYWRRLRGHFEL